MSSDEETPRRRPVKQTSRIGDQPPLSSTPLSASASASASGMAEGSGEARRPQRKSSQRRKDKFTPKRSVSFEDPPLSMETEISRPPSAVPEEESAQPSPSPWQLPAGDPLEPWRPADVPQPPWQPGERPTSDQVAGMRRQLSEAENMSLPPSRPVSAMTIASQQRGSRQQARPGMGSAASSAQLPESAPTAAQSSSGTFDIWSSGAHESSASSVSKPLRPKTAMGHGDASSEKMRATMDLGSRPKTAVASVSDERGPRKTQPFAADPAVAAGVGESPVAKQSSPLSSLTTPKRKASIKKMGSRMRMFPGSPGGTAAPDWSAFEGNDDTISLSNMVLPSMMQDDSLAADLLDSADDEEEDDVDVTTPVARSAREPSVFGDETDGPAADAPKVGLFQKANQDERLGQLYSLAGELRQEDSDEDTTSLLAEFGRNVQDEMLVVGTMSVDELQAEERRIRAEQIALEEHTAKQHTERQQQLTNLELEAKKNVYETMSNKRRDLEDQRSFALDQDAENASGLHRAYSRAEGQLQSALEERKAEVTTLYGDLQMADDGQYSGSRQRRWKLEWQHTPQPVEIKLKLLRGVKDKLPAGRYVMLVSLFDRLGGHILRWSNLAGQQWGGVTLPVQHRGRFHDLEMEIDQSVYTVCPSRIDVKPGMVLVFELFILRGATVPTDRVVGWGTFPICDAEFNVVEGRYKCVLLRGERDPTIDRHSRIEQIMAKDLDSWLCNVYFDILKLPRYLAGQKEYEVELQFSSAMLGFPDRLRDDVPTVDGNDPIVQSQEDIMSALKKGQLDDVDDPLADSTTSLITDGRQQTAASKRRASRRSSRRGILRSRKGDKKTEKSEQQQHPAASVQFSRKIFEKGSDSSSSEEEDATDSGIDGYMEDPHDRGLYYRVHSTTIGDERERRVFTMRPNTPLLKQKREKKAIMSKTEELKLHTVSVHPPFSVQTKSEQKAGKKWSYVRRQFLSEVGLSQWRSREFWAVMLMFVVVFWIRIYMHYIGQWIFLTALLIPINKFDFLWISVNLNYQPTLLYTRQELAVVLLGPVMNIFLFALLVLLAYGSLRIFNSFPHVVSRFILAYGVLTALDPVCIVLVDLAYGRYVQAAGSNPQPIGDAFKLYFHFSRVEGTGVAGVFLTLFGYLFTTCLSLALVYVYFLRLHLNGRMLDVYHRLNGKGDDFFAPFDLEVSNEELSWVCRRAEQWRGEEGERRKVAVYDYVWEEADDSEDESLNPDAQRDDLIPKKKKRRSAREITTHVSIHTLHLDGLRELFRHFLRLPDGAIVEVIGEMGLVGMETRIRAAMQTAGAGRGRAITSLPHSSPGALDMDAALFQNPMTQHGKRASVSSLRRGSQRRPDSISDAGKDVQ